MLIYPPYAVVIVVELVKAVTLSFVPTVIAVPTVLVGILTIAVTLSPLALTAPPLAVGLAASRYVILPEPEEALAVKVTVGCVLVNVLEAPITEAVEGEPRPVRALALEPIVTPVTTASPVPVVDVEPVATVIAVPNVGAVLLLPLIIKVSALFPVPIVKDHVEAFPALVTLGTVVVTRFLFVSALTDLTKVSDVGLAYPVTTVLESLLFQAAPPPEAEALRYLVVPPRSIVGSVTVNVVLVPSTLSVCPDKLP